MNQSSLEDLYDNLIDQALQFIPNELDHINIFSLMLQEDQEKQPLKFDQEETHSIQTGQTLLKKKKNNLQLKNMKDLVQVGGKHQKENQEKFQKRDKDKEKLQPKTSGKKEKEDSKSPGKRGQLDKQQRIRSFSSQALKPIKPKKYQLIADYIEQYQQSHKEFFGVNQDETTDLNGIQQQNKGFNQSRGESRQQINQNVLNLSTESNEKQQIEEEIEIENHFRGERSPSPIPQKQRFTLWDNEKNPYNQGWAAKVLKQQFQLNNKKLSQLTKKKHKTQRENYYQDTANPQNTEKEKINTNFTTSHKGWVIKQFNPRIRGNSQNGNTHNQRQNHSEYQQDNNAKTKILPVDVQQLNEEIQNFQNQNNIQKIELTGLISNLYLNYNKNKQIDENNLIQQPLNEDSLKPVPNIQDAAKMPIFTFHFQEAVRKVTYLNYLAFSFNIAKQDN